MVNLPPEVQIRAAIKPGSVYYFPESSFSSPESHYFVVLNHNPLADTFLVLVCASSQIEKVKRRRRNCPPSTLVEMTPAEYSSFTKPTIIDCNEVHEYTVDDLVSMRGKYDLKTKPEMDAGIVAELRRAVCTSPLVAGKIKTMLAGATTNP